MIVSQNVRGLARAGKEWKSIDAILNDLERELATFSKDSANQLAEAEVIFSRALSGKEVAAFAEGSRLTVVDLIFNPFSEKRKTVFGTGFFNLATRHGLIEDRIAYFEGRHLRYTEERIRKEVPLAAEEKEELAQKIPYFRIVVHATPSELQKFLRMPEVKTVSVRKILTEREINLYQQLQQSAKIFQDGVASGELKVGPRASGGTDTQAPNSSPFQGNTSANPNIRLAAMKRREKVFHFSSLTQPQEVRNAPHLRKLAQSLVCTSFGSNGIEKCPPDRPPNTNTWLPADLGGYVYFVVYPVRPESPYVGYVFGQVYSPFQFPAVTAFRDQAQVPCLPSAQVDFTAACQNNGVYVANVSYEHESRVPNPLCPSNGASCFQRMYAYTNLPPTAYEDTRILDNASTYNATLGTVNASSLTVGQWYQTYYEIYSSNEDLAAMSQTSFTYAGQIGTHFGLTFNPPFNVYGIDTTNIARFFMYPVP
jgi:hypothetical protein